MDNKLPTIDGTWEHPIAEVWRPSIQAIVEALRKGDFTLSGSIPMVRQNDPDTATQIREYIDDYGATIASLPENAWATSVYRWMDGYWELLIDLWTEEEGLSDMVLAVRARSHDSTFVLEVVGVRVP